MGKKHPKTHQLEIVALEALSSKAVVSNGGKKKNERERENKEESTPTHHWKTETEKKERKENSPCAKTRKRQARTTVLD